MPGKRNNRLAVYTVFNNWRGGLPPAVTDPRVDSICFVEGQTPVTHEGWELREFQTYVELDSPRASRMPKILPHLYLPEYEYSVYIDPSVELKPNLRNSFFSLLGDGNLGLIRLSRTLDKEFTAVSKRRYDNAFVLMEQNEAYSATGLDLKSTPVYWGGMILRKHNEPEVIRFANRWITNVLRFSRRDQLSLPIALNELPESSLRVVEGSDAVSSLHRRLKGEAKTVDYVVGTSLRFPRHLMAPNKETLYMAEISSLRRMYTKVLELLKE